MSCMRARQIDHLNPICAGTGHKHVIYMIFQLLTCYTDFTLSLSSIYFSTTTRVVIPELESHVKIGRCSRVVFPVVKASKCGTPTTQKQTESNRLTRRHQRAFQTRLSGENVLMVSSVDFPIVRKRSRPAATYVEKSSSELKNIDAPILRICS